MHFSCRFEFSIFTHFNWNLPLLLFVSGFNFFYSSWAKDWNPIKVHWLVIIPLASKIVGYFNSFSLFAYLGIIVLLKPFHLNRKNRAFLFGTFKNPLLTKTTWNEISKALCSLLQQKKRKKKALCDQIQATMHLIMRSHWLFQLALEELLIWKITDNLKDCIWCLLETFQVSVIILKWFLINVQGLSWKVYK